MHYNAFKVTILYIVPMPRHSILLKNNHKKKASLQLLKGKTFFPCVYSIQLPPKGLNTSKWYKYI